ncbi:MAG: serine/threonine protein kinase [Deltaproteobacteria bacterium]|nr:serine/threonine protein kinase [Deltaproteobacteria bacterium]
MNISEHEGEILDGRYRLLERIGEGGMGAVYLGQHVVIGRQVAVKLLRVEFAGSEQIVKRFYREAHAAATIKHGNIIDIFDLGVSPWGEPYLVMEHLEGESLGDLLDRRGAIDFEAVCGVLEPTLQALEAAHQAGVVHRDLKPENIFLVHQEDEAPAIKLIDFGISKFAYEGDKTRMTQTGSLLGTPDFMSPEQARGKGNVDHRADIWGIGVILYECLTLERPFMGSNYNELILNILTQKPKPPSEIDSDCPPEADAIVMRALEKDPDKRYQSAVEMLDALKELDCFENRKKRLEHYSTGISEMGFAAGDLGANSVTVPVNVAAKVLGELVRQKTPDGWSETERGFVGKHGAFYFGAIGLVALVVLGFFGAWFFGGRQEKPPEPTSATTPLVEPKQQEENAASDGVQISLQGVPEGAKVYYQDALVPMNPFRVDKKTTVMPLRVETEGYEIYSVMIVPSEDKVIEVTLEKRAVKNKKERPRQTKSTASIREKALDSISMQRTPGQTGLTESQQQYVYNKNKQSLKRCYDDVLAQGSVPADKVLSINMKLYVSPGGSVTDTTLSGSGSTFASLNACLKKEARKWKFPKNTEETPVTFSFAFTTKE